MLIIVIMQRTVKCAYYDNLHFTLLYSYGLPIEIMFVPS